VKYLGLMENLRVRRAGFAYRRTYEAFLERYKCLSKQTWPNFKGSARDGVQIIANELSYGADDYRMGRTKIFIRLPQTLFQTEDAFQLRKNFVASLIQARWKGKVQRKKYLELRASVIATQAYCRRLLAKKRLVERRAAVGRIRFFIKGFITRNQAPNECNAKFIQLVKQMWLLRLAKALPLSFMNHTWPQPAAHCEEASKQLKNMHLLYLAKRYRDKLTSERRAQFDMKVLAESVFRASKRTYPKSIPQWFVNDRVADHHQAQINSFIKGPTFGERVIVSRNF
jgi:myosin-1